MDAIAEATQTIYLVGIDGLGFFPLRHQDKASIRIEKADYFTLTSGSNRKLTTITHTTELGDNLTATTGEIGTTQYIRDNPFITLREDADVILDNALSVIDGLTINQCECEWRGNFFLEIGDKIEIVTKDDEIVTTYLLNDVTTYDGTLSQTIQWHYEDNETETEATPTSIGGAIKQTFAKVDKVNRNIELLASNISSNSEKIAAL